MPAQQWAAFTTVGDPLVRVTLEVPRDPWRPAALVGATVLILAAGALILIRRRRRLS